MVRPLDDVRRIADPSEVDTLVDPQGRRLDYLRIAVTDRCNLRCRYCMPAAGHPLIAGPELLALDELLRLVALFCAHGVRKVRVTGGEPLLRPGLAEWLAAVAALPSRPEVLVTTNGTHLLDALDALARAGVRRINLSLDSLRPERWSAITRRSGHDAVLAAMDGVLARGLVLKLNVVVIPGTNEDEILDFVALTRDRDLTVRFIEPMPFSGDPGAEFVPFDGATIRSIITSAYDLVSSPNEASAVDHLFAVPGHRGRVAIIEGYTRSFCASCSRLRLDPRGRLRTCLYGTPAADLGALLRGGASDLALGAAVRAAIARRSVDGHAAGSARSDHHTSMASIGG
jgi:GTP 3',8-cyclase